MGAQDTSALLPVNAWTGDRPGSTLARRMSAPPAAPRRSVARPFRIYASLAFAFAWVPIMYTAFTGDRGFSADQYVSLWSTY